MGILRDRRILVCGGSSGLGYAIAEQVGAEGGKAVIAARDPKKLDRAKSKLGVTTVRADLATQEGAGHAVSKSADVHGGLDGIVVNAGGPPPGTFDRLDDEAWEQAVAGTLYSSVRLIRAVLPVLAETATGGAIAIILSSSIYRPIAGLTTSNVLRPGLHGLVKDLAPDIAPTRINGIAPGRIATDRIASLDEARAAKRGVDVQTYRDESAAKIPLKRYGEPREFAHVACFLLSKRASYVHGTVISVDGGAVDCL